MCFGVGFLAADEFWSVFVDHTVANRLLVQMNHLFEQLYTIGFVVCYGECAGGGEHCGYALPYCINCVTHTCYPHVSYYRLKTTRKPQRF